MIRNWKRLSAVPLLAAALWIAGCSDQSATADRLLGPDAVSFAKDTDTAKEKKDAKVKAPKVKGKKKDGRSVMWTKVVGKMPEPKDIKSEVLVDGKKNVMIENNGHYLFIPKGAVSEPTTFRIRAYKKVVDAELDLTEVAVELRAFTTDPETGEEIDAGADGFDGNPVYLGLTYDWAENFDAQNATIVWLKNSSAGVEGEQVDVVWNDPSRRVLIAELLHFSDYALVMP